jgi:hypothetical protein
LSSPHELAPASMPSAIGVVMDRRDRRARVAAYVRDRLYAELEAAPRGRARSLAKEIGFTTAHIANVKNGRAEAGDDFVRAIAAHWKMEPSEVEAEALKRPAEPARPRTEPYPAHTIVAASPEFANASDAVKEAFTSLRGRHGAGELSVVQWSLVLDGMIRRDELGVLETGGGKKLTPSRK